MPRVQAETPNRTRVLVSADHYLPGVRAGGPIRSISALVAALGADADFHIVTRDRDLGAAAPYPDLPSGRWLERHGARVLYCAADEPTLRDWELVLRSVAPDVVYLNSFFSPRFSLALLLLRRLGRAPKARFVVAPRGELHPGALAIRRWKKAPFLHLARAARLAEGVVWHATAAEEAAQVRRWFGARAEVAIAPVLAAPSAAEPLERAPKRPGHLEVAFLSRISEKKNLLGALDLLSGVAGSIRLNVYGPKEDAAYWQRCQEASARLPSGVRMCDRGELPADEVRRALARNHVLLLPTWGENFGHVILESLLAGVPVLISDQTPWRDLEGRGAGWDLPLAEPDGFRSRLRSLVEMNEDELARWSRGAERLGLAYARDPEAMSRSRDLLVGARCA